MSGIVLEGVIVEDNPKKKEKSQKKLATQKDPSEWCFYDGDIVIKRISPIGWDYVPVFGTVLKQRTPLQEDENSNKSFNVRWELNNMVEMVKPEQVTLVDRLLLRNTKVENEDGIAGTVTDWNVTTSVQLIGTNHVIEKVPLERLRPITSYIRGQEIIYQDWVGVIVAVKRNIWFALDGGMTFFVPVVEKDGFVRNDPYWGLGMPCPGIRTKLTSAFMRNAKWTSGPMKFFSRLIPPLSYLYSMAHVTLTKSEVTEINVNWLSVVPTYASNNAVKPPIVLNRVNLKNVTIIGMPSTETAGVNSVRMLKLKPEDYITNYSNWNTAFIKKHIEGDDTAEPQRSPIEATLNLKTLATDRVYEVPVKVLSRQTNLDVEWNNGTVEKMSSTKVPKILQKKEDAEFPQAMVVAPVYTTHDLNEYYGVVMDSEDLSLAGTRKVNVMWILNGTVHEERTESVFNLKPHPSYSMFERGTIVFPKTPGTTKFRAGVVSDINISVGKMVVTVTSDHSQHEAYPHLLVPMPRRCFWNFFSRQWAVDEIIVPPYQLQVEYGPEQKYVEVLDPSPDILSNNNPDELSLKTVWDEPVFEVLAFAPETHRFYNSVNSSKKFDKRFMDTMGKEIVALKKPGTIPDGIWMRCYENRLDLISVLMVGPSETPYEDGIFMFDLQLKSKFPEEPPRVHHVSYSYELNPYISWDGNVCVSALAGLPVDGLSESLLANYSKQIQALLFSPEPLLDGPREFVKPGTPRIKEYSKSYNEFVLIRVMDSTYNMIHRPHEPWSAVIKSHFASVLPDKLSGYENWNFEKEEYSVEPPVYPLLPASEGFQEAFMARVQKLKKISPPKYSGGISVGPSPSPLQDHTPRVKDSTADSESVYVVDDIKKVSDEQIEIILDLELVDPNIAQNANEKVPETATFSSESSKLSTSLDSEKNIVKSTKKSKSKDKKKIKGKSPKGKSSASSAAESDDDSVKTDEENTPKLAITD